MFTDDGDGWAERATLLPSDPAPEPSVRHLGRRRRHRGRRRQRPGLDYVLSNGAAYIYEDGAGTWAEQAKLTSSGTHVNDRFGWSVGIDGGTVVVGAPYRGRTAGVDLGKGAAVVFNRDGDGWISGARCSGRTPGRATTSAPRSPCRATGAGGRAERARRRRRGQNAFLAPSIGWNWRNREWKATGLLFEKEITPSEAARRLEVHRQSSKSVA